MADNVETLKGLFKMTQVQSKTVRFLPGIAWRYDKKDRILYLREEGKESAIPHSKMKVDTGERYSFVGGPNLILENDLLILGPFKVGDKVLHQNSHTRQFGEVLKIAPRRILIESIDIRRTVDGGYTFEPMTGLFHRVVYVPISGLSQWDGVTTTDDLEDQEY